MFVSALLQYNSSNDSLSTNLRLRWEYRPGSELFVVYNEATRHLGAPFAQSSTIVPSSSRLPGSCDSDRLLVSVRGFRLGKSDNDWFRQPRQPLLFLTVVGGQRCRR